MPTPYLCLHVEREGSLSLYQQVCRQIVRAVQEGRLRGGDALPPSRALAEQLNVSRTVVVKAYEHLHAEGYLEARRGSGTRISETAASAVSVPSPAAGAAVDPVLPLVVSGDSRLWRGPGAVRESSLVSERVFADFRHGSPSLQDFPVSAWRKAVQDAYARVTSSSLDYGPAEGAHALRVEVARMLGHSRAMVCDPAQVLMTTGATQALDILVRLLVRKDDVVLVEDPCHLVLRQIFGVSDGRVVSVPVDGEGMRVDDITPRLRASGIDPARVRLVYVTPSHQFPTGVVMSRRRRHALREWASLHEAYIVEDDYHNEFTFTEENMSALASGDESGRVIYVGTFSKTLFPALRIGFAVVPHELVREFLGIKWIADRLSPSVEQEALAQFLSDGSYARHIGRMRRLYRQRRRALLEALYGRFGGGVRISGEAAGLHVLVSLLDTGLSEEEIAREALRRGVRVYPASDYFTENPPADPSFLLGYACLPTERIPEGIARLAEAAGVR
ncbi:PLP-dependent aminotransferase family protein [Streptomyces sp. HNM0574]|uniref:MocR-like pyridoxine biosynthesis transcription factor PdxR n=1 Tax=Streptomyces sp. HNM0574 TaxID=2714954 RepID=UPI00146DE98E|nr:PLP-dependent aminotransferase family protein [Streptomyces sp. HNM0574]NLU67557.1 PLP-dependent aminotransferase family protein [Streptomyces sp. HNM0574]